MVYQLFIILFLSFSVIQAQNTDVPHLKSFTMMSDNDQFSQTIHPLNNTIDFSFDDVKGTQDTYYYKIVHCQIDWKPSDLPSSYYIQGFDNFQINQFENSFGTLQNYTHYTFTIPNENTVITKSGNYLIQILNDDDDIVCQRKLILHEQKSTATIRISESRDLSDFNNKQATSLIINAENLAINYPDEELKTFVFQNGDLQIRTPFLKPTFIQGKTYTYRPTNKTEFFAGNEFYYFDNNEILRNSRYVAKSYRQDQEFHSVLFPKKSREGSIYTYNPDINGNFLIRNHQSTNTGTEAEYSMVHFALKNETHLNNKNLYVYGAFNNFQFSEENKLKLDETQTYLTAAIFLKQGFYNYDFVSYENGVIDKTVVSGSHFETENNYEVLVYFQPINSIYYDVVGYGVANSKEQREN
ncbi:type IX secretion system plug protein domain-containing protein [Wenyingzhuangia sp. 2_MG-2023]|uniref:type IX secretion system plug protein n=1 Tax=Wenyingzhuangia sp. 2_MG-2023 TaxID=3062639 RepID=UPI0026E11457|nr:type IX secretion system plug protein domain-containing protein [Wenyingzhuangia sp. 2_MG-2023]MDO6737613.1 DUF5103 domain-containing protein [Wenyingzhuangia sp. 2_MG-2023]